MKFLKHALIRRKIDLPRVPMDRFRIEVASCADQYRAAFRLLQVGYMFQGIEPVSGRQLRIAEHHVLRASTVLVAYEGDQVVGTMTVTLDTAAGLPLDADFPAHVGRFRATGRRLAELGSFAIVRRCWGSGVAHLLGMGCVQIAARHGAEQLVIGVHPRAGDLYGALWGFRPFAKPQRHQSLDTSVLGLQVDLETIGRHADRYHRPLRSGHTLREHVLEGLPFPCFDLPRDLTSRRFARIKLQARVFRQLFRTESDRYETLSSQVRRQLEHERSDIQRISA